jgi:hypothetical protein
MKKKPKSPRKRPGKVVEADLVCAVRTTQLNEKWPMVQRPSAFFRSVELCEPHRLNQLQPLFPVFFLGSSTFSSSALTALSDLLPQPLFPDSFWMAFSAFSSSALPALSDLLPQPLPLASTFLSALPVPDLPLHPLLPA